MNCQFSMYCRLADITLIRADLIRHFNSTTYLGSKAYYIEILEHGKRVLRPPGEGPSTWNSSKMVLQILHPNHMFFCLVKYSLSGYYGLLPGFEMHEMKPEVINRKRQICQETLDVIEKIDQGIGVRKGLNPNFKTSFILHFWEYVDKGQAKFFGKLKIPSDWSIDLVDQ